MAYQNAEKVEQKVKTTKKLSQTTHRTERFKTSIISWGFGSIDPWPSGNVLILKFIGRGFESQPKFKVLQNPWKFLHISILAKKHFAIIFWLAHTVMYSNTNSFE